MNKWTVCELNKTDDITFAMSILAERKALFNPNAPLAQKIAKAISILDRIRGGCPVFEGDCLQVIRERIFLEVERERIVENIKTQLAEKTDENGDCIYDLHGLTIDEILADSDMIGSIIRRYERCECNEGYWDNLDYSINQGINDVIEHRKGE